MNLQTLKTNLDKARAGIFNQMFFDYSDVLNQNISKTYPFAFWDIGNSKVDFSLNKSIREIDIDLFGVDNFIQDQDDLLDKWDAIELLIVEYITAVKTTASLTVQSDNVTVEYYSKGLISIDSEVGVRMRLKLKLWC